MNENLNLVEILKDCPRRTKLYSPVRGEVEFMQIDDDPSHPIECWSEDACSISFNKKGQYFNGGECMLFPSKEQRDWSKFKPNKSKFDPKSLQPFDKVLARKFSDDKWYGDFVSTPPAEFDNVPYTMFNDGCSMIIPYNEETKHLIGTMDEAPEFYRYWED